MSQAQPRAEVALEAGEGSSGPWPVAITVPLQLSFSSRVRSEEKGVDTKTSSSLREKQLLQHFPWAS